MANPKNESQKNLSVLNEDLENYFANTIIPQLFVDADLILRKFTPPAMKHFSLSNDDIDRDIHEVKDNIRYPTLIDNIEEVIITNEILEKEIQTTDGKWFQMNILPYYVRKEKRTNGVIITFVDITRRIQTLKELENLNSKHDTLIYALTHDIRQPLSAIVILADGLKEAYKRKDDAQFEKWIETLKLSSNTMKILLKDFIDDNISDLPTREERVNIENIYQNIQLALKDEIVHNHVTVSTEFNTSEIKFSRNNLRSILYNLLSNAVKFRRPEEPLKILITTKKIEGFIVLSVKDNGLGIAEEHLDKIFEKSKRLNSGIEGTGMGLFVLKRMVVNNGGKIEVLSEPGKGSTFNIYFKSSYKGEN